MRSKRGREETQANLDVSTSLEDRDIIRSVSPLEASTVVTDSLDDRTSALRPRLSMLSDALLDRFSNRMVSCLHGSSDFSVAESRCRQVLTEFERETSKELTEKLERHMSANRVLAKALNALRQSPENIDDLKIRLAAAEERAGKAEHTVEVLRWHLQNNGGPYAPPSSGPPNVF